ncbi:MAG: CHAT domain-containing protein [Acidobacteria bacterium]|nr:CHAT domain-containing protein [Acidobacteriota bacterium]
MSKSQYAPLRSGAPAPLDAEDLEPATPATKADQLHRLGAAELARGMTANAREHFARAASEAPTNAEILSDLAASEIALGRYLDAAEHAGLARELDPTLPAAAFNWALAMEKVANRPAAIAGWQRYLQIDAASGWAAEARQHVAQLQAPRFDWPTEKLGLVAGASAATIRRLVERYPQHARTRIQNILLPEWAESGDPALLSLMQSMAAVRAEQDPFLADVVAHAATRRLELREGFREFKAACNASEAGDGERTAAHFGEAARIFEREGSPLKDAAAIYSASAAFFAGHADSVLERMQTIEDRLHAEGDRYPSMRCEAAWTRGLVLSRNGHVYESLDAFNTAREAAHASGESEHEVSIGELIATDYETVGDAAESEDVRLAALRASDETNADAERMYVAYAEAAFAMLRNGRTRVGLAFLESQAALANAMKDAQKLSWTAGQRALGLLQLGRPTEADRSIDAARQQALLIKNEGTRDWTLADIEYIAARSAMAQSQPAKAIDSLTTSLRIWDRYAWRLHTANGYAARAEAHFTIGDRTAAESDYRAGIAEMEKQRATLEPTMRVAYFERSGRLFDGLIDQLIENGRNDEALTVVEQQRARGLLERLATKQTNGKPLDAATIARSVPNGVAILEIALLEKSTDLWLVRDGRIVHRRVPIGRAAIEKRVEQHLAVIHSNDATAIRNHGRWLYDQLLAPIADGLAPTDRLVIASDSTLQALPFAALVAPDGRYLVAHHTLATASSASVFLRSQGVPRSGSVLAVAEAQPEGLEPLRYVAAEASSVARNYTRGALRSGKEIAPPEFLERAGAVDLVYFAGHARTDTTRPARSALLFESGHTEPAALTAFTIGASRLASKPLVVLAACSTARGPIRRNEGTDSLASAFLQAGARGVVATLWDVRDIDGANLFHAFHRHYVTGASPAEALRAAQLELLQRGGADSAPSVWASASVFGTL